MNQNNENEIKIESPIELTQASNQIDSNDNQNYNHNVNDIKLNAITQYEEELVNCSKTIETNRTVDISSSCIIEIAIKISEDNIQTLKIKDVAKSNKDVYDFCVKNSLDYVTMETIQSQINTLIKESIDPTLQNQINRENTKNTSCVNSNNQRKPIEIKNKYIRPQIDFDQRSYSMTLLHKESKETPKRTQSQKQFVTLFPYQIGITSCRVERIKHKHKKNNKDKIKAKNKLYTHNYSINSNNDNNNISYSSSYLKSIQGKCLTSPIGTEDNNLNANANYYNPTISTMTDNYQPLKTAQNQSKTVQELLQNSITKDDGNNFYLISEPNSNKRKMTETINNKSDKLDRKINYGILLYERGLASSDRLKHKISTLRQEMNKKREDNDTFYPSVNPISKQANDNRIAKGLEYNNPNTISDYKSYSQEKNRALKEKFKYIEMEENDNQRKFIPEINHSIRKPEPEVNQYSNPFERLYNYQQIRDRKLQALTEVIYKQYSYRPQVNKNSRIKMKFDYRLIENESKMALKKEELAQKVKHTELYDNKTNQPLFQPKFQSRSTREVRTKNNETKKERNKNMMREAKKPLNSTSEEIFESKKVLALKRIFRLLDSDDDGEISTFTMNKKALNKIIIEILQPLFNEMKESTEAISEKEFIDICTKLYQVSVYYIISYHYRYYHIIKRSN